jgi:mycothiol synthase
LIDGTGIRVRSYRTADLDKYVRLLYEVEKAEPMGRCVSRRFVAEQLIRPNYCPEQDLYVAETDDDIVGYVDIEKELAIGRVILDCRVHPNYRRRGVAAGLLDSAMNRARSLEARVAHVNIREDNLAARRTLSRFGFRFVRRFLELGMEIGFAGEPDLDPSVAECRYLRMGDEGKLTGLQNSAFEGTWGFNPNTIEQVTFRVNAGNGSHRDIVLIREEDEAVGYCWTGISCEATMPSLRKGRILMLGVDPHHRGKGIGRRLMMAGLARLRSKGIRTAELTVDSENKAARALYESLGFEVQGGILWYEKAVC